jgi:hypothetical protein
VSDDRLTLTRFERILDAFGAEPDHWPATERARAVALLASSLPARRALRQAQLLDRTLARFNVAPSVAGEADRLAALLSRAPQLQPRRGPATLIAEWLGVDVRPGLLWPQAIGLAAAMLFGFYIGATDAQSGDGTFDLAPSFEAVL